MSRMVPMDMRFVRRGCRRWGRAAMGCSPPGAGAAVRRRTADGRGGLGGRQVGGCLGGGNTPWEWRKEVIASSGIPEGRLVFDGPLASGGTRIESSKQNCPVRGPNPGSGVDLPSVHGWLGASGPVGSRSTECPAGWLRSGDIGQRAPGRVRLLSLQQSKLPSDQLGPAPGGRAGVPRHGTWVP